MAKTGGGHDFLMAYPRLNVRGERLVEEDYCRWNSCFPLLPFRTLVDSEDYNPFSFLTVHSQPQPVALAL